MLSGQHDPSESQAVNDVDGADGGNEQPVAAGRSRRSVRDNGTNMKTRGRRRNHIEGYNALDEMDEESDASSSGGDWDGADEDEADDHVADEEEEEDVDMSDDGTSVVDEEEEDDDHTRQRSLVVSLRYQKKSASPYPSGSNANGSHSKINETTASSTPASNAALGSDAATLINPAPTEPCIGSPVHENPYSNPAPKVPNHGALTIPSAEAAPAPTYPYEDSKTDQPLKVQTSQT